MEPGKVSLLELFGRETLDIHDVFITVKDSTKFLQAYAFNEKKSIKQATSSGHKKVWRCTSNLCQWHVTLGKRHEKPPSESKKQRLNTKNSFCPPGAWFVREMNLQHSPNCDSVGECSMELLMQLPGFKGSIVQGLSCAKARVSTALKTIDNVNVDHRPALVHRAISQAKSLLTDSPETYEKLPAFLRSFERENPGSRVCCQLDHKGRFYRLFLSIGALIATQDNWIPLLECDGTHMKNAKYNGICVLLVGKDGDWANVPVAIAFIHKETASNFEWFFGNCAAAGIKLHDRATFTDRGKQLDAQIRLKTRGVNVQLKFCALHIFFNVCSHFRSVDPNIDNIRPLIFQLQATTTLNEYENILSKIQDQFPLSRNVKGHSTTTKQSVAQYLRTIHPTSWTKFGNSLLSLEERQVVEDTWKDVNAYGIPCALFGGRTTSAVEGQNNALLMRGIRDCEVFGALVLYCNAVVEVLSAKKKLARDWVSNDHTVTPRANSMFQKQVWAAAACTVRKSTETIYHVDDSVVALGDVRVLGTPSIETPANENWQRTYTVDLEAGNCSRCADRIQLLLPCRHVVAAMFSQNGTRKSTSGVFKYFHRAYTVRAYHHAFVNATVSLPFVPALLADPSILAPPLYNQAGGRSQKLRRDMANREKRIPSRGEPKISRKNLNLKTIAPSSTDQVETAHAISQYFAGEIRSQQKKKRRKYKCSRCGESSGHNAANCPSSSIGDVDLDVLPGNYVVGGCPFEILQRQIAFIDVHIEVPNIIGEYTF